MPDSGEIEQELRDREKPGFVTAQVKWEKYGGPKTDEHRIMCVDLADPWKKFEKQKNRIESTWRNPPQGKEEHTDETFKIGPYTVGQGKNGKNDVKWTIWDESRKLTTLEAELYSVMRAEYYFINKEKYRKCASKYYQDGRGENYGVDSFFMREESPKHVICESKFTTKEKKFARWKNLKKKQKEKYIWGLMAMSDAERWTKQYPQMSWQWLRDRIARALEKPAGLDRWDKEELIEELEQLEKQVGYARKRRFLKRYVNYFGAELVPIYPGRYRLITRARNKQTKEVLHLKWHLGKEIDFEAEFIELGKDFDNWCRRRAERKAKKKG